MPPQTVLLAIALLVTAPASAGSAPEYRVRLQPQPAELQVRVCVPGEHPTVEFVAHDRDVGTFLLAVSRSAGGAVERAGNRISASNWQTGECLDYRVDLAALIARRAARRRAAAGGELIADPDSWLWRVDGDPADAQARIDFELPEGWSVSAPWTEIAGAAPARSFRLGALTAEWESLVAFGRFAIERSVVGNGNLRVAVLGSQTAEQAQRLRTYINDSALDVVQVFPNTLQRSPQLIALPVEGRGGAVPFGQTMRGGGQSLVLLVNPSRPAADFAKAWTLTHEFVHLIHPYLGSEGRWISEGLATYYQNVLRARSGRISAADAWDELDAGFERGRNDRSGDSLGEVSATMERGQHFMRGYWSGAALMLRADLELRQRRDHPSSLDAALNGYLSCCRRSSSEEVPPAQFLAELDRIVGGEIFSRLYREHVDQAQFPDLAGAYQALGLRHGKQRVELSSDPDAARLRAAIMGSDESSTRAP